jgi:ADP-heptose:LPS heptosyltransferase
MALKKILLIRFSSIGDIILTSPVIRCIKKQLKDVELHVVTKNAYQSIFASNPYVDKVYDFSTSLKEVIPSLRTEHYDFVVDLHRNWRSFMLKLALRCPVASFSKLNLKKLLLTLFKINLLPDIHIVDRYFMAVEKLGVVNDGEGLDFFGLKEMSFRR